MVDSVSTKTQSNVIPSKPDTVLIASKDKLVEQPNSSSSECCRLIVLSSPNRKLIEKKYEKLLGKNISGFKIDLWFNISNNTQYYRIISECFNSSDDAVKIKQSIADRIIKLIPDAKLYIKCESK